jgi:rubrerythrin
MMDQAALRHAAEQESFAAAAALAATERAVNDGRLNIAKVLRATALAARQRAIALSRIADNLDDASDALTHARNAAAATEAALGGASAPDDASGVVWRSANRSAEILGRTIVALESNRDVPESVVAQILLCCEECGYLVDGARPEVCPSCGAIAGEFALFAPFFSGTQERIARLTPEEALKKLNGDAARLADALVGDDAVLRRRPSEHEWCAKEIAGHMLDIAALAIRRLSATFDAAAIVAPERTMLPWKLLDSEDYPDRSAEEIKTRFADSMATLVRSLEGLPADGWRQRVDLVSGRTLVVDVASWVANHNTAHLEQIRALLRSFAE